MRLLDFFAESHCTFAGRLLKISLFTKWNCTFAFTFIQTCSFTN